MDIIKKSEFYAVSKENGVFKLDICKFMIIPEKEIKILFPVFFYY